MHSSDRYDELKSLIEEAANEVSEIGPLVESVKWGQPSFSPAKNGVGSSVRIEEREDSQAALMFICTTGLASEFRQIYADELLFEGSCAIAIHPGHLRNRAGLKHCIQLALTYKIRKKARG